MTADLFQLLDAERTALINAVECVPPEHRDHRPSADVWSVAEVIEHLATVERGVTKLLVLRGAQPPQENEAPAQALAAERITRLRGRSERLAAPARVRPSGTVSAADALVAIAQSRSAFRDAVSAADPTALAGCTHPHPVLGTITLADWVRFVAHHEARHTGQVQEIAAALASE